MGSYTPPPVYLTRLHMYTVRTHTHMHTRKHHKVVVGSDLKIKAQCDRQGLTVCAKQQHGSMLIAAEGERSQFGPSCNLQLHFHLMGPARVMRGLSYFGFDY